MARHREEQKIATLTKKAGKITSWLSENEERLGRMIERFDTERGRHYYSKRMGAVEPVFGNTRAILGMDRFTLRGRAKVDAQWKLYRESA